MLEIAHYKILSLLGASVLLLGAAPKTTAHPAHAEPVNYPYVVGFERFHTELDGPEHLAKGGLILLNELNCVACHTPPAHLKTSLTGRTGTRLTGVADRFEPLDLEMMIRNPRFVKTDTIMPSLFAGPDRDLEEIEALKHFLATLHEPLPGFPDGDIDTGRLLYHQVGCVSCHAPEMDYRPPWLSADEEVYQTSLPSVPMNLADRYPREALIDLIMHPNKHRPSGRMPRFDLTQAEAIDIGSYLNSTPKVELPDPLLNVLKDSSAAFSPDTHLVDKGRKLFASKNCTACHSGLVDAPPTLSKPLQELKTDTALGCLSERPTGGEVPFYGLGELQKTALREALSRIQHTSPPPAIDWTLSTQNCYACHERGGKGGPESAREFFFTTTDLDSICDERWSSHPPKLDGVGQKLTDQWWAKTLYQNSQDNEPVRSYLSARMPIYPTNSLDSLVAQLKQEDNKNPVTLPKGNKERGKQLLSLAGKNCVLCHGLGTQRPPGVVSQSLDTVPQRITPTHFGTFLSREAPHQLSLQEAADVWHYLETIDPTDLPDGLLKPDITEQIPDTEPIVVRAGLKSISDDALLIGLPGGKNLAFDIPSCQWVARWTGRFVDPGPAWEAAGDIVLEPLAPVEHLPLPNDPPARLYRGYRLDPERGVAVIYWEGRTQVEDYADLY